MRASEPFRVASQERTRDATRRSRVSSAKNVTRARSTKEMVLCDSLYAFFPKITTIGRRKEHSEGVRKKQTTLPMRWCLDWGVRVGPLTRARHQVLCACSRFVLVTVLSLSHLGRLSHFVRSGCSSLGGGGEGVCGILWFLPPPPSQSKREEWRKGKKTEPPVLRLP